MELLTCKICGTQMPNLAGHLYRKHGMKARDYKIQYNIDRVVTAEQARKMNKDSNHDPIAISHRAEGIKRSYTPKLREQRRQKIIKQYQDPTFIIARKNRVISDVERKKMSDRMKGPRSEWSMLRERLYIRAENKCEICHISEAELVEKGKKKLVVHEKNYDHAIPKDEDCTLCCSSCHRKLHNKLNKDSDRRPEQISSIVIQLLKALDLDLMNDNFYETPRRFSSVLTEFSGIGIDWDCEIEELFNSIFESDASGLICEKNIETYALCPHHLLPVTYKVTIAYLPQGYDIGLSKLGRLADLLSKKLQLQETYTKQLADSIVHYLKTPDVAVIVNGKHDCMRIRGIKQPETSLIVSEMRGAFRESAPLRAELLSIINLRGE